MSATGDFEDVFWEQVDAYLAETIAENDTDPCDHYTYEDLTEYTKLVSNFRIQWGQSPSPYNDSVPACTSTTNKLAGCVAVAMGQIMSYHGRPLSGTYTHPRYNRTVAAQYNWTAMKANANAQNLTTTAGKSGVANILAEAGTKVYTSYGCEISSAFPSDVPSAFSQMGYTSSSTAAYNASTIINNLDINYPVFIWGYNFGSGHAWVVEGYKKIEGVIVSAGDCPDGMEDIPPTIIGTVDPYYYLYFNLGWGGTSNGYYLANVFSTWHYPQDVGIIYNIHPN